MQIEEILDRVYIMPAASRAKITAHIIALDLPRGHVILRADRVEDKVYFISKGIVRAYTDEITFWFGKEGDPFVSMRSYVENKPGYESIELLEDCGLYMIDTAILQQLYSEDIHIANWGRKFAEGELIRTEERLISRQFRTAAERYAALLKETPDLLQRVQLGHIASYLGITQVSLSRIRGSYIG